MSRPGMSVTIEETGEVFNSCVECARYLGVHPTWLSKVARGSEGFMTIHGYHITYTNNYDPRRSNMLSEYRGRPGTKIKIIETGEVFNSISDCAEKIHGSKGCICDVLSGNRSNHKGYHFEKV